MSEIVFTGKITSAKQESGGWNPTFKVTICGDHNLDDSFIVVLDFAKTDGIEWWVGREVELAVRLK